MRNARKARAIGFNHVALEVGDIDEALAFYGRLFDFKLRGKSETSAFIDLGDQFLALQKGRGSPPMMAVISDWSSMTRRPCARRSPTAGVKPLPGPLSRFPRPVGQPHRDRRLRQHPVHQGAARPARHGAVASRQRTRQAIKELADKGMAPG